MAFRGDHDFGHITMDDSPKQEGLFRALIKRQAVHDPDAKLIAEAPNNANYCSPDIQNQLIALIRKIIFIFQI